LKCDNWVVTGGSNSLSGCVADKQYHTLITIVHRSKNFWGKQLLQGILRFVVFDGVYGSVEAKNSVLAKLDKQGFSFKTAFFGIIERKRKTYSERRVYGADLHRKLLYKVSHLT
jgi:hypothetical protein